MAVQSPPRYHAAGTGKIPVSVIMCYEARMTDVPKTQLDKFKQAARDLECDDDERRFDERLKKLVKQKPVERPE